MKLVDKLMVYKGQYGYSTLLKNKEDKLYVQVGFRKGNEPKEEKTMIEIHDGFLSFYKDKNGLAKPKIVVLEYVENKPDYDNNKPDYVPFTDNDIPPITNDDDSELPF